MISPCMYVCVRARVVSVIPGPPSNVTIIEVTSDTVLFHVMLPIDNGGVEVIQYRVEYEEKILDFYTGRWYFAV